MPDGFTHLNLSEVEDSAPKFGFEEHQEARFASEALATEQTGFSLHRVKPGRRQGFGHRHEEAEEIYVVLAGSGRMRLDEEVIDFRARPGGSPRGLCEVEDQKQRVVDGAHLVEAEVADLVAESARIDSADHLAQNRRRLAADFDLRMEARGRSRLRGGTDDNRGQRE